MGCSRLSISVKRFFVFAFCSCCRNKNKCSKFKEVQVENWLGEYEIPCKSAIYAGNNFFLILTHRPPHTASILRMCHRSSNFIESSAFLSISTVRIFHFFQERNDLHGTYILVSLSFLHSLNYNLLFSLWSHILADNLEPHLAQEHQENKQRNCKWLTSTLLLRPLRTTQG